MQNGEKSLLSEFFHKKYIQIILIVDVLIIFIIIFVLINNAKKTSVIAFDVTPLDAKILVSGKEYENGKTYKIVPGNYQIEISHDGLNAKQFDINLENDHALTLSTFLTDGSGEFYELKENYGSFQKLSEIASADNNKTIDQDASLEEFIAKMNDILSISEILPIKGYVYEDPNVGASTAGFTIQSGSDKSECKRITCLLVKYYGNNYKDAVTEEIIKAGYNPTNYQIFYERYN